jgi:hypothetical protein
VVNLICCESREFIDELRDCHVLKEVSVPWQYSFKITYFVLLVDCTVSVGRRLQTV